MVDLLKKLMFTPSVSGREDKIREVIKNEIEPYCDDISVDNLGNLIAHKKGNGKKIMLCAHMDEIGFFVTSIDESGFIHVSPIGGVNFLYASFTEVISENGIHGVLVPSNKDGIPKAEEVYIDIGAKDKKAAEKKVDIGDFFVFEPKIRRLQGNRYIGRPFDDRVGCAILIEAIKSIKKPQNDLYFVFSTQEEVGSRGGKPATYSISPDIGIALDVTGTGDKPGSVPMIVKLGKGCAIKIKDTSVICDIDTVRKMRDIAKEGKIKYQDEVLTYGGTDASVMQYTARGARVGAISIPSAFIHTGVEMIDMFDVKEALKLTIALCNKL